MILLRYNINKLMSRKHIQAIFRQEVIQMADHLSENNPQTEEEICRKSERNTKQKESVKSVFSKMRNHPTAEMVCDAVSEEYPDIGRATVYRVLNSFVKNGYAIKIPVYDGADRYDITVRPHSHAKCRVCGAVADIMSGGELVTDPVVSKVIEENGFLIEGCTTLYYGVCAECGKKAADKEDK